MFYNGKKTIAVFVQQPNEEYQSLLCKGISRKAKELDYNVAIFTNFGGYGHDAYDIGEKNIVNLPYYEDLDGIIIAPDTMNLKGLEELYNNKIKSRSHCPVVSVRKEREEYYNVLVDNNVIMEEIITHFIEVHKFTRINFLSGPKGSREIDKRLGSYKRVLENHGIPVEEERIYYGDLWKQAAYQAVDYWLDSSLAQPQAIICANDIMAMTVCKALAKRGINVPEQIAVSGCDDIEEAEEFIPSITTVRLPVIQTGMEAVEKIHKHNLGENQTRISYIKQTATIYRASCGCNKEWHHEVSDRKLMRISLNDSLNIQIIRLAQMTTDLAGLSNMEDVKNKIRGNWFEYNDMSHFFLCLKENWDDYSMKGDTDEEADPFAVMECGIKNKIDFDRIKFSRKELFPKELAEDRAMTYFFALVHYLEHDYGYVGFSYEAEQTSMLTLQAWLNNISSALENVRMHIELNRMVNKLEDMSIRDELTGLYNRRVLDTLGKKSLEHSINNHSRLMFFIADMDKLKVINDKYGHTKGDLALNIISDALKRAADDDEICIRLGGDEFMAIGLDYDEDKVVRFTNRLIQELNNFNKVNSPEFGVYISYGWNLIYPNENTTIEECLFTADYRMYQQKYNKVSNNIKANLLS